MTAEIEARRQAYWQHGYRPIEIWGPDQKEADDGKPLKNPGKQPRGRWREDAACDPPRAVTRRPDKRALSTGVICGELVGLDVDILDQALADQVVALAEHCLTVTPLVRVGLPPKILLVYRVEHAFAKIQTPEMVFPNGSKCKVELLADGQQFVVDGIHPDTREPYQWMGEGTPETIALAELPVLAEDNARSFIEEAEALLRAAGAVPRKRPGKERERVTNNPPRQRQSSADGFFAKVNRAALANIAAWAPILLPGGHWESGTGAWRVSSEALYRDLEEDLSIHPSGIQDWGREEPYTPIDTVMSYTAEFSRPLQAALWLCERLHVDPATLGGSQLRHSRAKIAANQAGEGPDPSAGPPAADDAEIARLARLKPLVYEREREAAAEQLGCRVSMLDKLVAFARGNGGISGQGKPLELIEIEAWPDPVDGAALLDALSQAVRRYIVLTAAEADAAALWTLGAHCFAVFAIFPRLFITAAEMQSGKTTLLDVLSTIVPRPLMASNITAAALFRTIDLVKPSLLLDEADSYAQESEELRGIINSGHRADGTVIRTVGEGYEPRSFDVFSPMAIAAIGDLAATILDRSVVIRLRRRRPDEVIDALRLDRAPIELKRLARQAARWAADHGKALAAADPAMPASITNRAADNWRPLLAIADRAGGEWPARGRGSAISLTLAGAANSARVQLLEDIRAAFAAKSADRLSSEDLVAYLVSREDRPWPEWGKTRKPLSKVQLARMLKPFGISPGSIRLDDGTTPKGYRKSAFEDAFARYLLSEASPF